MSTTLILFDIDGTILLSGGAGARALDRAFHSLHGLSGAMEGIGFAGRTDPAIVREVFTSRLGREPSPRERDELFSAYLPLLEEEVAASEAFTVMPGIGPLLETLSARADVLPGLVTGNVERAAGIKLGRPRLRHHFLYGGYGSDSEQRAELTGIGVERGRAVARERGGGNGGDAVRRVLVVGDTPADVRAGKSVGALTVAVATGMAAHDTLAEESPDLLLDDLADPTPLLVLLD